VGYKIREIEAERKFCEELSLESLTTAVPVSEIEAILIESDTTEQRHRRLTLLAVVLLVIALHLYSRLSTGRVFKRLVRGWRFIWVDPDWKTPNDSALSYRRYQPGARPMRALFRRLWRIRFWVAAQSDRRNDRGCA